MNVMELAEMLDSARKNGYDKKTLDYLTGWIVGKLTKNDGFRLYTESEFRFWSGYDKEFKS